MTKQEELAQKNIETQLETYKKINSRLESILNVIRYQVLDISKVLRTCPVNVSNEPKGPDEQICITLPEKKGWDIIHNLQTIGGGGVIGSSYERYVSEINTLKEVLKTLQ